MAWENRNGKKYYYTKRREGRRVISEYHGAGILAELEANTDDRNRWRQKTQKNEEQRQIARWLEIDRQVDQTLDRCSTIVGSYLLMSGFHTHHGTWRLHRVKR
jgi:hypothetical protein